MSDFAALLERSPDATPTDSLAAGEALAEAARAALHTVYITIAPEGGRRALESAVAEIDARLAAQINLILHHPEFQRMEATWRGLAMLLDGADGDEALKVRCLDISKRELVRTLRKFRGTAFDQSPIFRKVYEEEYGQLGGEPYGVLVGDYAFDHHPEDVQLLHDIAAIAAAAHAPFIAAAAPSVMRMESWAELANPRDISGIFRTPEYTSWRSLRESEDARYLGLCLPRFLARLPYGGRTEPVEAFDFEEDVEGADASGFLWGNPAFAMAANIARAFSLYGWCVRIRGIDGGGAVEGLPQYRFDTADGDTDRRCATELALSERREAELAQNGFIPLMHRKGADAPAFIGAQSLQKPAEYDDPAATANAALASRLPYMFASCRFAHYLKCMVRDKIGTSMDRVALTDWLQSWLRRYVDGSPERSTDAWRASHPLMEARVVLEAKDDQPGQFEAKFYLRPHYQLEGMTAVLRLVSRVPAG